METKKNVLNKQADITFASAIALTFLLVLIGLWTALMLFNPSKPLPLIEDLATHFGTTVGRIFVSSIVIIMVICLLFILYKIFFD